MSFFWISGYLQRDTGTVCWSKPSTYWQKMRANSLPFFTWEPVYWVNGRSRWMMHFSLSATKNYFTVNMDKKFITQNGQQPNKGQIWQGCGSGPVWPDLCRIRIRSWTDRIRNPLYIFSINIYQARISARVAVDWDWRGQGPGTW